MDEITNLIMNNERLIYSIANYFKNYNSKEDLYQAGCLGLITAYKKYNPNMNSKFTTYAYPYILGEMRKLVREDKGLKISREITKLNLKIEKAYVLLTQKLMKEPSVEEIARFLEIPEFYVAEAILSLNKIKSIDEPVNDEGRDFTLQDVIGKSENIDELIMLKELIQGLNNEEKAIIDNRYMKDYTQSETSKLVGMSQVQVSRKEQKVLQKLKQKMLA
ncbi:MAG: sigma-70 family RNA polymerase sigma factor [Bacilli bacterium]|nr:sigma-70 family RNA polymerase sigma factor [Bacilli bacterium]